MEVAYKWKIIVLGEPSVGKTSLMLKFTEKKFNELYIPTMGVQVSVKQVPVKQVNITKEKQVPGKIFVELNIWDIAGQQKFRKVRKIFYEGASAILLLYDVTNDKSFEGTSYWVDDLREIIGTPFGILVGNKIDLTKERVISQEQGKELAANFSLDYMETSAKTGDNIEELFGLLTRKLLDLYNK
jgi:small GTP-binding protein